MGGLKFLRPRQGLLNMVHTCSEHLPQVDVQIHIMVVLRNT